MNVQMKIPRPGDIEVTLTATLSIDQWKLIKDALPSEWPCFKLRDAVTDAIRQVEQVFYGSAEPAK